MEKTALDRNAICLSQKPALQVSLDTLRSLVPLNKLSRNSLRYIVDHAHVIKARLGAILFDVGDTQPYTFYLLQGVINLQDENGEVIAVKSGADEGRYAVANLLPRQYRARVASNQAVVIRVDRNLWEKEIVWGQLSSMDKEGIRVEDNDWKMKLLHTPMFAPLPMANVQKLFESVEEVKVRTADVVIREGDPGDYYYIIRAGRCKVVRNGGGREIHLGSITEPESFGEEALISDKPRSASVVMETDGVLLRLSKENFQGLMQAPLLKRMELKAATQAVVEGNARLIDVRMEEEFAANHLPHASNIPLMLLYLKALSLNKAKRYIAYCDTGSRSEAAAFILTRSGLDAYVLKDAGEALAASA
jgi:CRP-like cAMP-binding protein